MKVLGYEDIDFSTRQSSLQALERFRQLIDKLNKELSDYPKRQCEDVEWLLLDDEQVHITEAWERERDGRPQPGDAEILKKLRKDIPLADELIPLYMQRAVINLMLSCSRDGYNLEELWTMLHSDVYNHDAEASAKAVQHLKKTRKLPN